jgi:hypothetical protein
MTPAAALRGIVAVFGVGSALQLWMVARSWVYFDQVLLLRLGLRWAVDRELVGWGKVMSGGAAIPGSALELAVGLPLSVWMHARSPLLLLFATQLAAGVLLVRLAWRRLGPDVAIWLAVVYWLSPWRLFHGGFLWEPHYLLLPAVAALWAAFSLRPAATSSRRLRLGASLTLGATVALAPQLHASGALLGLHLLLLLLARRVRPSWGGLAAGGALGALPLIPALGDLAAGELPPLAPVEGHPFVGLLEVHPLLKSLTLWVRIASGETGRRFLETVFLRDYGGLVDAPPPSPLAWAWAGPLSALAVASAVVALVAQWRTLRRVEEDRDEASAWLLGSSRLALLAVLIATAISPVGPQLRYLLVFLHLACLPLAMWLAATLPRARALVRAGLVAVVLVRLPVAVVLALGHPMYRPPEDPARRALLSGPGLSRLELVPAPFGSGKERELPAAPP